MIYYIDVDNTITYTHASKYEEAVPRPDRIEAVNKLYDYGHTVCYFTARGMVSGKDFREFTEKQLLSWGCRFHKLVMGKPSYDVLVDDKSVHPDNFFS